MFEQLSQRLSESVRRLRGQGRLTEDNIKDTLREVRMALLEADVALPVVRAFIERVRERALGREVIGSLTPGQALIGVVREELEAALGERNEALDLRARPPVVIMLAGLQGAGKTTTAAKLARYLQEREKKSVMMVSVDVQRPAAIDQLETLAGQVEARFFRGQADQPVAIAREALSQAQRAYVDVLIVDTAGRLAVDEAMMQEAAEIHEAVSPTETLFVVDSMTGQDAANTAAAFNEKLALTGVILTKTDGDARGGAALSVRHVTGKPIKFLGIGEKIDALEPYHPDRVASRLLGMGDVLSLVEEAERSVDQGEAERLARNVSKGKGLTLEDLRDQMLQMKKLGGMGSLLDKLPGMGKLGAAAGQVDDKQIDHTIAIINSMTPRERRKPDLIRASRKRRIAAGSGTRVQDVNRLLKQHMQMQKMMKKMGKGKGGMQQMMRQLQGRMQ